MTGVETEALRPMPDAAGRPIAVVPKRLEP